MVKINLLTGGRYGGGLGSVGGGGASFGGGRKRVRHTKKTPYSPTEKPATPKEKVERTARIKENTRKVGIVNKWRNKFAKEQGRIREGGERLERALRESKRLKIGITDWAKKFKAERGVSISPDRMKYKSVLRKQIKERSGKKNTGPRNKEEILKPKKRTDLRIVKPKPKK